MAGVGAFGCAVGGCGGVGGLGHRMAQISISVAYAPSVGEPFYQELMVESGITLLGAIHQSGVLGVPELSDFSQWLSENADSDPNHKAWYVGIYSVKKRLDTVLMEGDRVEIYRPLMAEPMVRRKIKTKNTKKP